MLAQLFIYSLFAAICLSALFRPWIGLVGFYGFVLLEPNWNWRWAIPEDQQFQPYIACCTLAGFVFSGFSGNRLDGRSKVAVGCLLGFLLLAYVSSMQSIDVTLSRFYFSNLWKVVLMAVLTVWLLNDERKILILLWVMVIAQGYSAFRINEQYFQDGYSIYAYQRNWGSKGDNNLYTIMTVPLVGCSAALALYTTVWWQRALAGGICLLQIHQIMLMESRGGMLAAIGMLGIILWKMPRNRYTLTIAGSGLLLGLALAGPPVVEEFGSIFKRAEERDGSAQSRIKLWKAGYAITKDYPLLGAGPYAGSRLVPRYYEGGLKTENKGLHNLLFEVTTGCGIPAAVLYFSYFGISWFSIRRIYQKSLAPEDLSNEWLGAVKLAVFAGLPGYIAASMFSSGALLESSYALASIGLAAWVVAKRHEEEIQSVGAFEDPAEWDEEVLQPYG